jgi:hypothetical protein
MICLVCNQEIQRPVRGDVICACTFRANDWIYAVSNSTVKGWEVSK